MEAWLFLHHLVKNACRFARSVIVVILNSANFTSPEYAPVYDTHGRNRNPFFFKYASACRVDFSWKVSKGLSSIRRTAEPVLWWNDRHLRIWKLIACVAFCAEWQRFFWRTLNSIDFSLHPFLEVPLMVNKGNNMFLQFHESVTFGGMFPILIIGNLRREWIVEGFVFYRSAAGLHEYNSVHGNLYVCS